jgi:hypothetical protein
MIERSRAGDLERNDAGSQLRARRGHAASIK